MFEYSKDKSTKLILAAKSKTKTWSLLDILSLLIPEKFQLFN